MNVTLTTADFGAFTSGAATILFNVQDFSNGGHATATAPAGGPPFRLDVTAGNFAPNALHFSLSDGSANRLCEGTANCLPGSANSTPINAPFVGTPKQGNALGNVQWDGADGTISLAWTWLK